MTMRDRERQEQRGIERERERETISYREGVIWCVSELPSKRARKRGKSESVTVSERKNK